MYVEVPTQAAYSSPTKVSRQKLLDDGFRSKNEKRS